MATSSSSGSVSARPKFVTGDTELGKVYSVSPRTVLTWRKSGMPCKKDGRQWRYQLSRTDKWVAAYRREHEIDVDSTDLNTDLKREKLAQEKMRTSVIAHELAVKEGELLPRIAWERFATELLVRLGDLCDQLPDLIGSECSSDCKAKVMARVRRELDTWRSTTAEHLKGEPQKN